MLRVTAITLAAGKTFCCCEGHPIQHSNVFMGMVDVLPLAAISVSLVYTLEQ